MKHLFLPLLLLTAACSSPETTPAPTNLVETSESEAPDTFNPKLAEQYGADDWGMRSYVMAFLQAGPNRDLEPEAAAELQAAHMANIGRMAEAGQLVVAGPFLDDGTLRGIYLFATESVDSARVWTSTDPAIQAGSLRMEMHPWYGSAALMAVPELGKQLAKTPI